MVQENGEVARLRQSCFAALTGATCFLAPESLLLSLRSWTLPKPWERPSLALLLWRMTFSCGASQPELKTNDCFTSLFKGWGGVTNDEHGHGCNAANASASHANTAESRRKTDRDRGKMAHGPTRHVKLPQAQYPIAQCASHQEWSPRARHEEPVVCQGRSRVLPEKRSPRNASSVGATGDMKRGRHSAAKPQITKTVP